MLTEKEIDESKQSAIDTIQSFLKQMENHRSEIIDTSFIDWKIKVYKYMLLDPEIRLRQYMYARFGDGDEFFTEKVAVQKLGWNII